MYSAIKIADLSHFAYFNVTQGSRVVIDAVGK